MTTIFYKDPELVIAINRKVIFLNPSDLQIFKEIELPEDLTKCGLKAADDAPVETEDEPSTSTNSSSKKPSQPQPQQPLVPTVQQVKYAPNRPLLAITTAGQKALLLYECRPEHAKLVSVRALSRASSALTFTENGNYVLVTDKTGDCYQFDCTDVQAPPRLLLGHLSIVYDVLLSPDAKYIITCDRDDKIRVTNYPQTYDIHGYCLGHKEFVAEIVLLDEQTIASVSGDKTLRIWNYVTGKQLICEELPAPGVRLKVRRLDTNKFLAAVQLYQPQESIGLFEISRTENADWQITQTNLLNFSESTNVSNLCFVNKRIYVICVENERFKLQIFNEVGELVSNSAPAGWIEMVETQFAKDSFAAEDYSNWFKKRYDNVSEYLERKKRRIEEKQKA